VEPSISIDDQEGRMETTRRKPRPPRAGEMTLAGPEARERLIDAMPVTERRLELGGIPTAVLEGGAGPPLVLLHGPGEFAAKWFTVIPDLVATRRVIAPDLPGHGASGSGGAIEGERVRAWLGELIARTCPAPPALVGQIVGGAIAARFASRSGERVERLVLVDALGLAAFRPAAEFGSALGRFLESPTAGTLDGLWARCAFDLDAMRERLGDRWPPLRAYALDRAKAPTARAAMQSLMATFGMPAIPEAELEAIAVPTFLIWGRHDLATPLAVAQAASARYGWPLEVVEGAADDPPLEQPAAFLAALRRALGDAE
jgi:pimeloyl-ACP methyl ester carboxylesterase